MDLINDSGNDSTSSLFNINGLKDNLYRLPATWSMWYTYLPNAFFEILRISSACV
jgi:hypothetical protein